MANLVSAKISSALSEMGGGLCRVLTVIQIYNRVTTYFSEGSSGIPLQIFVSFSAMDGDLC